MFNLAESKAAERTFERSSNGATREQKFDLKFRSVSDKGTFTMSNKMWDKLNLDDDSLAVSILRNHREDDTVEAIAFGVVDAEDKTAKIYKKTERGEKNKTFNSNLIAKEMVEAGILNPIEDKVNQYISLSEYEEDGVTVWVLSQDTRDVSDIESYGSASEDEEVDGAIAESAPAEDVEL